MKIEKNIFIAFLLNLCFSIFEFIGGAITNSVAIISDSIHDLGDALSIGISYFLEKISKRKPDEVYTYGYLRYSVLGGLITTIILITGSILVIYASIKRIINPVVVDYSKMILLAILGLVVNFIAAYTTREGKSLNQKAVNLHMLEDVLGWAVVLIGAILMYFTDISLIDPLMSIGVALFILVNALKNFKEILDLFLEKIPNEVSIKELKKDLTLIDGVIDIHHIHIWSIDGINNYATMHVVTKKQKKNIKKQIREKLLEYNIKHVTIELESEEDFCDDKECFLENAGHHHHHH